MKKTGREGQIISAMESLGTYNTAFDDTIHALAILERELSRTMKDWKATAAEGKAPSVLNPHYAVICSLRKDIQNYREELGLTPKSLRRMRGTNVPESGPASGGVDGALDKLEELVKGYKMPEK